jgi:hypothetical protein
MSIADKVSKFSFVDTCNKKATKQWFSDKHFSHKKLFKRRHSKWHSIVQRCTKRFLFVCLQPHQQFFSYLVAVIITTAENLDLHVCLALMAFSSEGSFTCHTYCNIGPQFIWSYPKKLVPTSHSMIGTCDTRIIKSFGLCSSHAIDHQWGEWCYISTIQYIEC